MQTVNFKCGHCGNLMGVSAEYLGQQVRCPHCQQVVFAPAVQQPALETTLPQVPSVPDLTPSRMEDTRQISIPPELSSIFSEQGPADDPFDEPRPPSLDVSRPPAPDSTLPLDHPIGPPPLPVLDSTLAFAPQSAPQDRTISEVRSDPDIPSWMKMPATAPPPSTNGSINELPAPPSIQAPRRSSFGLMLFITLVFMPLVLYSVLVTVIAILIYTKHQEATTPPQVDPREYLPDLEGDHPGVQKSKKAVSKTLETDSKLATAPLPAHLRMKIGDEINLGELRIKAVGVEMGKVVMVAKQGGKPEQREALILRLQMENLSKDSTFYPMDAFFTRQSNGQGIHVPLTVLMAGDHLRFFGGPAKWSNTGGERYDVLETHYSKQLKPGEILETFVCTNGPDPRFAADPLQAKFDNLLAYKGTLVWHVQVRRGLTYWKDRDYPTTAVFGVEFTGEEVKNND